MGHFPGAGLCVEGIGLRAGLHPWKKEFSISPNVAMKRKPPSMEIVLLIVLFLLWVRDWRMHVRSAGSYALEGGKSRDQIVDVLDRPS